MKTIKELEADLKLAIAINNLEWQIQLKAKLEDRKDVVKLINERCCICESCDILKELKKVIEG